MFDVGFLELLIIAVVALLVLGPQRLPQAARFAGYWVRRARAQWYGMKAEFERELAAEDMKQGLQRLQQPLRETQSAWDEADQALTRDAERLQRDIEGAPSRDTDTGEGR